MTSSRVLSKFFVPEIRLAHFQSQALKARLSQVPLRGYQADPREREGTGAPVCVHNLSRFERGSFKALVRSNIKSVLDLGKQYLEENGVVLIRGIDYGDVAPTTPARAMHASPVPEAIIAGMARWLGCRLVGYEDQAKLNSHTIFHDIRAVKGGMEGANGGGGLGMHMDMGFRPDIRPKFMFLAGLREGHDVRVQTPLLSSRSLYRALLEQFPADEAVLRDPSAWELRSPDTSGNFQVDTPLLTGSGRDVVFHLRLDRMFPVHEDARKALDHILQLIQENEFGVHMESGDLLIINNHEVHHRRSPMKASFDAGARLLMRSYARDAEVVPVSRVHPPLLP